MADPIEAIGARDAVAITKSDTTTYDSSNGGNLAALYIGGAGDVAVRTVGGTTLTFSGATAGSVIPIRCDRVMSTNTTATLIVGLRY